MAKNGLKHKKNHIQSFNQACIIGDSDKEFCAEFNGTNPSAKNLSCKKLYPKKALQENQKWAKTWENTFLYI